MEQEEYPDLPYMNSVDEPKMYISAPIFGIAPEARRVSFERGAAIAITFCFEPVVPPELKIESHDGACPPGRRTTGAVHNEACHFKADLKALLDCEAILLMPGWMSSWGCKMELQIAGVCGIPAFVPAEGERVSLVRL